MAPEEDEIAPDLTTEKDDDIRDIEKESSRIVKDAAELEGGERYVNGLQANWESWRRLEVFLHQQFKPDFTKNQNISETSLFKTLSGKDKPDGWFQRTDRIFFSEGFSLYEFHKKRSLSSIFYGKHLIPPELTGAHYGAVLIAYVEEKYKRKEDDMAVMLLDGIAGMYWVHLADQIDEDLKKYHEQTSALRLSDAEYRTVKDDVFELTRRLDEANTISARIRSQIDPTWQNLGAVASVFSLYLDENAKKIKYHKEEGTLEEAEADETNEDSWIVLEEETAHDGHPIDKNKQHEQGSPANLICTLFEKNAILKDYNDLKEYIWSVFAEGDNDSKERQRAFKFLLGNRAGEIQVVQLILGLATALDYRNDVGQYINTNGTGKKALVEGMKSEPILLLGKKCPLANDTRTMSFLNAIHELIVIILKEKEGERKKVHLRSVLVDLGLVKSDDSPRAIGYALVIFFCRGIFKIPEQLFIARPRDERKKHDTGRVVDMLCEATTFESQYQPTPIIRTDNDENDESKFWRDLGEIEDCNAMAEKFFQCNLLGSFIKNEMSPGCCISTGKDSTVIALKLEIKEED